METLDSLLFNGLIRTNIGFTYICEIWNKNKKNGFSQFWLSKEILHKIIWKWKNHLLAHLPVRNPKTTFLKANCLLCLNKVSWYEIVSLKSYHFWLFFQFHQLFSPTFFNLRPMVSFILGKLRIIKKSRYMIIKKNLLPYFVQNLVNTLAVKSALYLRPCSKILS